MEVTHFSIVMEDSDEQQRKHLLPMDVTEFGINMDDNDEHPSKHLCPMDVTEFGIIKYLRFLHSSKHLFGKYLIPSEISNTLIDLLEMISLPWITLEFSNIEIFDWQS
jgi:hypothetical protein